MGRYAAWAGVAALLLALCSPASGFLPAPAALVAGGAGRGIAAAPRRARAIATALSLRAADEAAVSATQTLIKRLETSVADLTALQASVSSEVEELQAALAEKQAALMLIEDRLEKVTAEIQTAQTEVQIASTDITPAIIVGDGRVGFMLKQHGDGSDTTVRSTSEMKFQIKKNPGGAGSEGPIYLCVPNSALDELIEACPEDRREDLVFMGSGNLGELLKEKGLSKCSQALIYFVINKLGEDPVDGVTSLDPEGLTCCVGKWAPDLAKRLRKVQMNCKILTWEQFEERRVERLVWTCSVHLVAKVHGFKTIGEVVGDEHWAEVEACMEELAAAARDDGDVGVGPDFSARMKMYTESVGVFNAVVKDLPFRNGYFYEISRRALSAKQPDPCPLHTKMLKKIKAVK